MKKFMEQKFCGFNNSTVLFLKQLTLKISYVSTLQNIWFKSTFKYTYSQNHSEATVNSKTKRIWSNTNMDAQYKN